MADCKHIVKENRLTVKLKKVPRPIPPLCASAHRRGETARC